MRLHTVYRFGAFELDPAARQLMSGQTIVCLTSSQFAILLLLLERAPEVADKDSLATAGWGGAAVSENSIEQAISCLRKALARDAHPPFIETVRHRGYRFAGAIQRLERTDAVAAGGGSLELFRALVQGRRELATLNPNAIADACCTFEHTVQQNPQDAAAHASLAMGRALLFEASRVDRTRDVESLGRAAHHAWLATTIDPALADGWSALGFAMCLHGDEDAAAAACRKGVALDREGWRHWLRLAYVSWGEERIEAAQTALALKPDLALAHWLKGTVLIARGASNAALSPIRAGCAAQDTQRIAPGPYPAVGLHLLHGLVLAGQEQLDEAMREFDSELDVPDHGQVYARERAANTWYARGAVHLRRGERDNATRSFEKAIEIGPQHWCAMAALGRPLPAIGPPGTNAVDLALARAVALTRQGRHTAAAEAFAGALGASASSGGWILPVEPILHVSGRPDTWTAALTVIRQRAS